MEMIQSVLIGSLAAQRWLNRGTNDVDYICTYEWFAGEVAQARKAGVLQSVYPVAGNKYVMKKKGFFGEQIIVEFEIAWEGNIAYKLLELCTAHPELLLQDTLRVEAGLNLLYTLKMSHRFLRNSPHFNKTMDDLLEFKNFGAYIPDILSEWYKEREKETYNYSHPSLAQSKRQFFEDSVPYVYDHDWLHTVVVNLAGDYTDTPTYTMYLKDGAEVQCDKDKWLNLLEETDRLCAVMEESLVLALERCLIPFPDGGVTPRDAFLMALNKVCTSITSGWFREFAWDNYYEVIEVYDLYIEFGGCYHKRFKKAVDNGEAILFNTPNSKQTASPLNEEEETHNGK